MVEKDHQFEQNRLSCHSSVIAAPIKVRDERTTHRIDARPARTARLQPINWK